MKNEEEHKLNLILASMKGSQRAQPKRDLMPEIEAKITAGKTFVLRPLELRVAVAAAILLLFCNIFALESYLRSENASNTQMSQSSDSPVLSNFNIYNQ